MSTQPPVETPPVHSQQTPPALPFEIPQIPVNIIVYVLVGAFAILGVAIAVYLLRSRIAHPVAREFGSWLTSPTVDAVALALDPVTREASLIPVKRVGSLYVGTTSPVYLIPVSGGESYVLRGAEKPLVVALRYSKAMVQWSPALEQVVSLSLTPVENAKAEPASPTEIESQLVAEVARGTSRISGTVYVGPDLKLYVSTRVPDALRVFKEYSAYATSTVLSVLSSTLHSVAEEGYKVIEAHRRLVATRWQYLIMLPIVLAAVFGLVWVFLHIWR